MLFLYVQQHHLNSVWKPKPNWTELNVSNAIARIVVYSIFALAHDTTMHIARMGAHTYSTICIKERTRYIDNVML